MSIHPTMTDDEIHFIMKAIKNLSKNHRDWAKDYTYNNNSNEFVYKDIFFANKNKERAESWFKL